jgi:hypothetical protein
MRRPSRTCWRLNVDRVVIANPKQVRMIAHAKIKTDAIDAAVLAKLYASGFLPEVWMPDAKTLALRRQVARRTQFVRQRVRLKNLIQSILHASDPAMSAWQPQGYQRASGWRDSLCQPKSGRPLAVTSARSIRSNTP